MRPLHSGHSSTTGPLAKTAEYNANDTHTV